MAAAQIAAVCVNLTIIALAGEGKNIPPSSRPQPNPTAAMKKAISQHRATTSDTGTTASSTKSRAIARRHTNRKRHQKEQPGESKYNSRGPADGAAN